MYSSPIYEGSNIFPHLTDREAEFKRNWPVQDHILSDGIWLSIEIYWIPELGLLIPIVIPPKRLICVSGERMEILSYSEYSPFIICHRLIYLHHFSYTQKLDIAFDKLLQSLESLRGWRCMWHVATEIS